MNTTAPIDKLSAAYDAAIPDWTNPQQRIEITSEVYDDALGCMPPVYGYAGGFWVGEPYTHDRRGREVSLECWYENPPGSSSPYRQDGSRYYCRMSVVRGQQ